MSCSPFDLRDYVLSELAEEDRREVERHVRTCAGCHEELERLRVTQAALLVLREEEVPQRIGFVSDKVFEPWPLRRGWQAFWGSAARLGFASAAMLSIALITFTLLRPGLGPLPPGPQPDTARFEAEIASRVDAAVEKAVAQSEARQARRTEELLAAAENRHRQQRAADVQNVEQAFSVLQKRYNVMLIASNDWGGPK